MYHESIEDRKFVCHCCLEALQVDQPLPMCYVHSIKSRETRVCKDVTSKNEDRCRDGTVCSRHGQTPDRKMVGTRRASPCKEGCQPVHVKKQECRNTQSVVTLTPVLKCVQTQKLFLCCTGHRWHAVLRNPLLVPPTLPSLFSRASAPLPLLVSQPVNTM